MKYDLFFKLLKCFLIILIISIGYVNYTIPGYPFLKFLLDVVIILFAIITFYIHDYIEPSIALYYKMIVDKKLDHYKLDTYLNLVIIPMNRHNWFFIFLGIVLIIISFFYRVILQKNSWMFGLWS